MSNLAGAIKSEITRLARRELRASTDALKKTVSAHRAEIAALKRRLQGLESQARRTSRVVSKVATSQPEEATGQLRFRAGGFKAHRERLGLSAKDAGLLIGASQLSVYKWEQGKTRPGEKHLEAIARLRKMGKREAMKRLADMQG